MKKNMIKQIMRKIIYNKELTTKQVVMINIENIDNKIRVLKNQRKYANKQIQENKNIEDWESYLGLLEKEIEESKGELEQQKYILDNLP